MVEVNVSRITLTSKEAFELAWQEMETWVRTESLEERMSIYLIDLHPLFFLFKMYIFSVSVFSKNVIYIKSTVFLMSIWYPVRWIHLYLCDVSLTVELLNFIRCFCSEHCCDCPVVESVHLVWIIIFLGYVPTRTIMVVYVCVP